MAGDRLDPVAQRAQVARRRALTGAERVVGGLPPRPPRSRAGTRARSPYTSSRARSTGRARRTPPRPRPSRPRAHRPPRAAERRHDEQRDGAARGRPRACASTAGPRRRPRRRRSSTAAPRADEEEQDDDERVRRRERAQERRDEPPHRALLVGVQDPVLGEAREAPVGEPELLLEPAGHAGVAPPLERHEVDVDEPPDREPARRRRRASARSASTTCGRAEQPAEEVRAERQQVVPERVQLAARRRLAVRATTAARASRRRRSRRTRARAGRPRAGGQRPGCRRARPPARRAGARPSTPRRRRAPCRARRRPRGAPSRGCGARARRRGRRARPRGSARRHVDATSVRPRLSISHRDREERPQVGRAEQVVLPRPRLPGEVVRAAGEMLGQPVDERQPRVDLDREPAVGRRQEHPSADAQRLAHERLLPLAAADVLDHGVRVDDVERAVRERQRARVALDVAIRG